MKRSNDSGGSFYIFRANYEELTKTLFLDYAQFLILFRRSQLISR
jgi:hypothetical protein